MFVIEFEAHRMIHVFDVLGDGFRLAGHNNDLFQVGKEVLSRSNSSLGREKLPHCCLEMLSVFCISCHPCSRPPPCNFESENHNRRGPRHLMFEYSTEQDVPAATSVTFNKMASKSSLLTGIGNSNKSTRYLFAFIGQISE